MKLFTPFTIPKKDNCDLCKVKTNKRRQVEKPFLDRLFKFLYRDRFDFVYDWKSNQWFAIFVKKAPHYNIYNIELKILKLQNGFLSAKHAGKVFLKQKDTYTEVPGKGKEKRNDKSHGD